MIHRSGTSRTPTAPLVAAWRWLVAVVVGLGASLPVQAETTITLDQFGVGNAFRPGGPIAVRVVIESDLDAPVPGLVQWELPNGDGDVALNVATLAIPARGGRATTWLTGWLPSRGDAMALMGEAWTFRVFETDDGVRTREIASARLSPSISNARAVPQRNQLAMVIGPNSAGLSGFMDLPGFSGHPGVNEAISVVSSVIPEDLPDTWSGLLPYDLLVWAANDPRFAPSRIETRTTVENALRRWMRLGGHLVILLPRSGDPWRLERGGTVLDDLLEGIEPRRIEAFPLREALPAISDRAELRSADATIDLQYFDPRTLPAGWRPLAGFRLRDRSLDALESDPVSQAVRDLRAALPAPVDGLEPAVIHAIRRDYGHGTIDVVGIDVADRDLQLQQTPSLPASWIFWNPILGRTAFTAAPDTITKLEKEDRLNKNPSTNLLGAGSLVSGAINMSGTASAGLLVGVVLFAVYWVIAGPLGFFILGRIGWRRFAWPAFFLSAAVFAGIAWLSGILVSSQGVPLQHLTTIRHVYNPGDSLGDPTGKLGVGWFSARLPGYRPVPLRIGAEGDDGLLAFFSPPPNGNLQSFPSVSRFEVGADADGYAVPARNTSAEFTALWRGGFDRSKKVWSSTLKVDQDDPIRVDRQPGGGIRMAGSVINATGAVLRDVLVAIVLPRRIAPRSLNDDGVPTEGRDPDTYSTPNTGFLLSPGEWQADGNQWRPGETLSLGGLLGGVKPPPPSSGSRSFGGEVTQRFALRDQRSLLNTSLSGLTTRDRSIYLQMLSMYQILPPPELERTPTSIDRGLRVTRLLGRDLDVSHRLSEPTILILAFADAVPSPIPIEIDGEDQGGVGTVLLQWLHPLPIEIDQMVPRRPKWFDRPQPDTPEDG